MLNTDIFLVKHGFGLGDINNMTYLDYITYASIIADNNKKNKKES
jgi:hypothetical protein